MHARSVQGIAAAGILMPVAALAGAAWIRVDAWILALPAALVAAWALLRPGAGQGPWTDRARAAALGGLVAGLVLLVVPYLTTEGPRSLWGLHSYALIGTLLLGASCLAWNACTLQALGGQARLPAALHALLLAFAAAAVLWWGDGILHATTWRGHAVEAVRLQMAPVIAFSPGLAWAYLVHVRSRVAGNGPDARTE